jgi:hypothetical protein
MAVIEVREQINDPRRRQAFFNVYKGIAMGGFNVRRSWCNQTGGKILHRYQTSLCNNLLQLVMPTFFSESPSCEW